MGEGDEPGGETAAKPRRAGRPREFDPTPVIRAGRELLETGGLPAFTIRALSQKSGATVTSIYRNLGDREAVLGAVADAYAAEIHPPELPEDPVERIIAIFTHAYDVLDSRRWVLPVLTQARQFGAHTMWYSEYFFRATDELGVAEAESVRFCRQLWAYTVGALQTRAEPDGLEERLRHAADKLDRVIAEEGYSLIARMLEHDRGLTREGFVDGLRTWVRHLVVPGEGL
ncbi:MAG: TetR/AcrR family transcriptional regulator [Leucobacter sp.]